MNISMEQAIYEFPDYLAQAQALCRGFVFSAARADRAVVLGMGGSAIGGDLVKAVAEKNGTLPLTIIRDENLPGFVNEKTAVIAVSYSGNTRETLSVFEVALARKCPIAAVSTGGRLLEAAQAAKIPFLKIPGGLAPRAALAFTFVPVLHALSRVLNLSPEETALDEAAGILKSMREELKAAGSDNEARQLARALADKLPAVFSPDSSLEPAARRFKCQINENAKHPAFFDVLPEAAHNSIMGFTEPRAIHKSLAAVFLRDSRETPEISTRVSFLKSALARCGVRVHEIKSRGKLFITRLLSLCYFGDYASYYLALETGADPVPITVIDRLKEELGRAGR